MITGETAQNIKCAADNVCEAMFAIRNNINRDGNISERYLMEKLEMGNSWMRIIEGCLEEEQ